MIVYRFPSAGYARRFARNARGRGYAVKVDGATVSVNRVDAQMRGLLRAYVGLKFNNGFNAQKGKQGNG